MSTLLQEDISCVLSSLRLIDYKERSFLESCLQVDPSRRWSASALLEKSLFSTKSSTAAAHDLKSSKEELRVVAAQLFAARNEAAGVSASISSEEVVASQLVDFGGWLIPKLEQLLSLTAAEITDLLNPPGK